MAIKTLQNSDLSVLFISNSNYITLYFHSLLWLFITRCRSEGLIQDAVESSKLRALRFRMRLEFTRNTIQYVAGANFAYMPVRLFKLSTAIQRFLKYSSHAVMDRMMGKKKNRSNYPNFSKIILTSFFFFLLNRFYYNIIILRYF